MRIIGIDVAPARGGHVYEGGTSVSVKCPQCLAEFLKGINEDVLIGWDAPLTACTSLEGPILESDLTRRVIEAFFATGDYKVPKGISVQGYSGCQHWTISRRLLGLPRIGPYDKGVELPFDLISMEGMPPQSGRSIVEVHPALALWVWFRTETSICSWEYKKDDRALVKFWELLRHRFAGTLPADIRFSKGETPNDDELDAVTAWLLAHLWDTHQGVSILGDERLGTFLLPDDKAIRSSFSRFSKNELDARRRAASKCGCTPD